jgi:hypothetical protein
LNKIFANNVRPSSKDVVFSITPHIIRAPRCRRWTWRPFPWEPSSRSRSPGTGPNLRRREGRGCDRARPKEAPPEEAPPEPAPRRSRRTRTAPPDFPPTRARAGAAVSISVLFSPQTASPPGRKLRGSPRRRRGAGTSSEDPRQLRPGRSGSRTCRRGFLTIDGRP